MYFLQIITLSIIGLSFQEVLGTSGKRKYSKNRSKYFATVTTTIPNGEVAILLGGEEPVPIPTCTGPETGKFNFIKRKNAVTAEECRDLCSKRENCDKYSWKGRKCFLYNSNAEITAARKWKSGHCY